MPDDSSLANTVTQAGTSNGSVRRFWRPDNTHIWLPLSVAAPLFAFISLGPLAARGLTRFPRLAASFADERWTFRGNVLVPLNYSAAGGAMAHLYATVHQLDSADRAASADRDYLVIGLTYALLQKARFERPALLTWFLRPMLPREGAAPPSADDPIDVSERIAIAITKCQLPANYQWMMREGLEQDMRRRGIAEHDIDRTILYLTNALQENSIKRFWKYARLYCWLPVFMLFIPGVRVPWWFPTGLTALTAALNLSLFQMSTLPMCIQNRRAVAEMLMDRLGGDPV